MAHWRIAYLTFSLGADMSLTPISLPKFITEKNITTSPPLPLVHSTKSQHIFGIFTKSKLKKTKCDVFTKDSLTYLFVGRPAYKWDTKEDASRWQLPLVLVLRFPEDIKFKRIFPFDSGAFARKLLPNYITSFQLENYNVSSIDQSIGRIVSLFFEDNKRYFLGSAISPEEFERRHNLTPKYQEVEALARLYRDSHPDDYDDRARAIEVQVEDDVAITSDNLIGVVLPSEYKRETELIKAISAFDCLIKYYDIYPARTSAYTTLIYDRVKTMYVEKGLIDE
jgi:hypothetical protein